MLLLFHYQISSIFWISNCTFICKCLVANTIIFLMLFLRCLFTFFTRYFQDISNIVQPLLVNVSLLPRLIFWMTFFSTPHHFSKKKSLSFDGQYWPIFCVATVQFLHIRLPRKLKKGKSVCLGPPELSELQHLQKHLFQMNVIQPTGAWYPSPFLIMNLILISITAIWSQPQSAEASLPSLCLSLSLRIKSWTLG